MTVTRWWLPLVALAFAACSPPVIHSFSVNPGRVCRGQPVTVSWSTSNGAAVLHVTPAGHPLSSYSLPDSGNNQFGLYVHTDFSLVVNPTAGSTPGPSQTAFAEPFTFSTSDNATMTAPCPTSSPVTLTASIPGSIEGLHITTLLLSRQGTVTHAGRSALVSQGAPSAAFNDLPVAGDYSVSVSLSPGEMCRTTMGGPELQVFLTVNSVCPELLPGSATPPPTTPASGVTAPASLSECGANGQHCCGGATCNAGLSCSGLGGFCGTGAPATNPCNDPAGQVYVFGLRDQAGCAGPTVSFQSTSSDQARRCADDYAQARGATAAPFTRAALTPAWHYVHNPDTCQTVYPAVWDEADAESCVRQTWCSITSCDELGEGQCP